MRCQDLSFGNYEVVDCGIMYSCGKVGREGRVFGCIFVYVKSGRGSRS